MTTSQIDPKDYQAFQALLEDFCGILLGPNKQYLVSSRLNRLMENNKIRSLGELVDRLNQPGMNDLRAQVVDLMTTNETQWFRDDYPFSFLREVFFPEMVARKKRQINVWSSACSTGQEPFSISMAFEEFLMNNGLKGSIDLKLVATDISPTVLKYSTQSVYQTSEIARGLSNERRQRFMRQLPDESWEVKPEIGSRISFKMLNLLENFSYLGRFDVIFCRNVLIYFSTELRHDIIDRMIKMLNPEGCLILGASESLGAHSRLFDFVRHRSGLIYRLKSDK